MKLLLHQIESGPDAVPLPASGVPFLELWPDLDACLEQKNAGIPTRLEVLRNCYTIYSEAEQWESAAEVSRVITEIVPDRPFGFIQLAQALHRQNRTQEAWDQLLPLAHEHPGDWMVRYNLACCACQLHQRNTAQEWLQKAIQAAPCIEIKRMALEDPDFEPLWNEMEHAAATEAYVNEGGKVLVEQEPGRTGLTPIPHRGGLLLCILRN